MIKCFNGHPMKFGVINCPICGACSQYEVNDEEDGPVAIEVKKVDGPQNQSQVSEDMGPSPEQAILTLEQRNAILLKWLVNIRIENQEQRKDCSDMLTNARQSKREAETLLKEAVEPSKLEIEHIKGIFNPFIEKLNTGINSVTKAMSEWDTEQERLQAEALKQLTEDQVDTDTGEVVSVLAQPVQPISKTTKSDIGSDTRRDSFDIVITNADLIPRQYCDPSMVKLRAGFKLTDSIPGAIKAPKKVYQTRRAQ